MLLLWLVEAGVEAVANMWMLPITCCKPSTSSDLAAYLTTTATTAQSCWTTALDAELMLVGGVGGVDSHLLQLNLACLRGSTLCRSIPRPQPQP